MCSSGSVRCAAAVVDVAEWSWREVESRCVGRFVGRLQMQTSVSQLLAIMPNAVWGKWVEFRVFTLNVVKRVAEEGVCI